MVGFWDGALAIGYKQLHGSVIAVPVHAVSLLWPHLKMGGTQPARPPVVFIVPSSRVDGWLGAQDPNKI